MILTEKTKNKSYCCKAKIYIEKIGDSEGARSERPYCSKCLKFPEASPEAWAKLKHKVDTGQILDSRFDDWKSALQYVKLANGRWVSKLDIPSGEPRNPMVKDCKIKPIVINLAPEYTDKELYDKFKNETLLDKK